LEGSAAAGHELPAVTLAVPYGLVSDPAAHGLIEAVTASAENVDLVELVPRLARARQRLTWRVGFVGRTLTRRTVARTIGFEPGMPGV
jgi:hypothetical protein